MIEEFITIRGLNIFTKKMGEGTPLVFLHGGPGGEHRFFLPHLEGLANQFQLVFYDQRGCGQSEEPQDKKSYTISEEVETLEELRQKLEIKKLNLVGESWGSMLALAYASRYPKHVNRLFLTAAVGATTSGYLGFGEKLNNKLSPEDKTSFDSVVERYKKGEAEVSEIFKILDRYYVHSPETLERKTKTKSNAEVNQVLGQDIIENYNQLIILDNLREIPILIAQGESDIITPDDLNELIVKYLPHVQIKVLSECGHWTAVEKPDVLQSMIIDYFGE
ncbi:alpha/beta fold hydrolase [Bacillus sp. CGMCC 1.16607]|uniref:alpha/beta fold hydrolase n=1 Tax=Bacillus sp. CGMCC 1.16607 TaxID=3351842 RepID=UPI00363A3C2E